MFPERWCLVTMECVNSSLDMGRGEGLEKEREEEKGSGENER